MPTDLDPTVGQWYQHPEKSDIFEVTALDEDNGVINVQYLKSGADEIDLDAWYELDLELSEAPKHWSDPLDVAVGKNKIDDEESEESALPRTRTKGVRRIALSDEHDEEEQDDIEEDYPDEDLHNDRY